MKCFTHPETDAVGSCKSCCRALCRECIVEVGTSCSCRHRCEADVAAINELFERSIKAYNRLGGVYKTVGVFIMFFGVLFCFLGAIYLAGDSHTTYGFFLEVLGLAFIAFGIAAFASSKKATGQ
jgi:hypothetical protein